MQYGAAESGHGDVDDLWALLGHNDQQRVRPDLTEPEIAPSPESVASESAAWIVISVVASKSTTPR